jgi:hypothetical protein
MLIATQKYEKLLEGKREKKSLINKDELKLCFFLQKKVMIKIYLQINERGEKETGVKY